MGDLLKVVGIALAVAGLVAIGGSIFDSPTPMIADIDTDHTALVVLSLDAMTVSFAGTGTPYPNDWRTSDDRDIVEAHAELISSARDAGILIIYVYGDYGYEREGDAEGAYAEEIAPQEGDIVIARPYDIHSLLSDIDFLDPLKSHGIEYLLFSGINTGFWVNRTAQYCLELGYDVYVVANAHSGGSPAFAQSYNSYWPTVGVSVVPISELGF